MERKTRCWWQRKKGANKKKNCAAKTILESVQKHSTETLNGWVTYFSAIHWQGGKKNIYIFPILFFFSSKVHLRTTETCQQKLKHVKLWCSNFFSKQSFPIESCWISLVGKPKKEEEKTHKKYARQQPAGRDQQVREHQQKNRRKKKLGSLQCWQINAAAKRPSAGELMEVVGGEGSWRRATQRINWKRKSWIVKRDQRREVWSRYAHTRFHPAPSTR